jgi:uncharacterized Zn finger protein
VTDFARPFLDMVEALRMGPTLASGRRAVRAGHIRSLTVSSSLATAQVRDPDEPAAHRARIAVRAFGAAEWSRVEAALVAQARFTADLLAGRMPPGIETVFAGAGLDLLPLSLDEIAMDCTCGHRPMPCVHVAATCYALAASFDTDPFGAFAWRGRPRDELLLRLRRLRGAAAVDGIPAPPTRAMRSWARWPTSGAPVRRRPGRIRQLPRYGRTRCSIRWSRRRSQPAAGR